MKALKYRIAIMAIMLGVAQLAEACRPFGSYAFVEDETGGIWYTEGDNNAVSRLAPDGTITSYLIPTEAAEPADLALGRDGEVWFTEMYGNRIGVISKDGTIREFDVPTPNAHPVRIAVDAEGNVWFTEEAKIGKLTPSLTITEHPIEKGWPTSIAIDGQGNLLVSILEPSEGEWRENTGRIALLASSGTWNDMLVRKGSCPMNLNVDSNGSIWFSDRCRSSIERIRGNGDVARIEMQPDAFVQDMVVDDSGIVRYVDSLRNKIGKATLSGDIEEVTLPVDNGGPFAIAITRSGDLYFSETYNYNLNRLTKEGVFEEHLVSVDHRQQRVTAQSGEVCYVEFASTIANKMKLERERARELKNNSLKETDDGASALAKEKCLLCHDTKRIIASRKSEWIYAIGRMQDYMRQRDVPILTPDEVKVLARYFNQNYGIKQ